MSVGRAARPTANPKPSDQAGDGGDAGYPDICRYIEQPASAARAFCRSCGSSVSAMIGLMLRRDQSATAATPPPEAGCVPFDQLKHAVQGRGVPRDAGG